MTGAHHHNRSRRLSLRTKLAFSAGSLEEATVTAASIATMLFYNQILGLSASLCGVVFLVASIVDGISDPLVGAYSDRIRSRWGRRHPLMLASALPLAVAFYSLYQPPDNLSTWQLFAWFLTFLILLRLAKTFYTVPHAALGAELTEDYHERTSVFAFNMVVQMAAGALFTILMLMVLFPTTPDYDNGLLNETRYPFLALCGALMIVASLLACTFGTRDQIPYLHQQQRNEIKLREVFAELVELLRNRSYLAVCGSWLVLATAAGVLGVVSTFTYIYAFELSTEDLTIQRLVLLPGIFLAIPITTYLTRRLDKKMTLVYSYIVVGFLVGLPHTLRMLGWFPDNDSPFLLVALFAPLLFAFLFNPVCGVVIDSQLGDITDDHEFRTGQRSEGVIFSIRTFAMKATIGLGGLIGGFGLDIVNFPENAKVGEVPEEALMGLLFMSGPLYWLIVILGICFAMLYQLTEARHKEILTVLEQRRALSKARL